MLWKPKTTSSILPLLCVTRTSRPCELVKVYRSTGLPSRVLPKDSERTSGWRFADAPSRPRAVETATVRRRTCKIIFPGFVIGLWGEYDPRRPKGSTRGDGRRDKLPWVSARLGTAIQKERTGTVLQSDCLVPS